MILEATHLACQCRQLTEASDGHLDRRDEVALLERLHEVGERPRIASLLDDLAQLNEMKFREFGDPEIATRIAQYELAYRMQTSVPELTDFSKEPQHVLDLYGPTKIVLGIDAEQGKVRTKGWTEDTGLTAVSVALNGKTIAQLWDFIFSGDKVFAALEEGIRKRYPDVKFVSWREFGNTHGADERKIIASLPADDRAAPADLSRLHLRGRRCVGFSRNLTQLHRLWKNRHPPVKSCQRKPTRLPGKIHFSDEKWKYIGWESTPFLALMRAHLR